MRWSQDHKHCLKYCHHHYHHQKQQKTTSKPAAATTTATTNTTQLKREIQLCNTYEFAGERLCEHELCEEDGEVSARIWTAGVTPWTCACSCDHWRWSFTDRTVSTDTTCNISIRVAPDLIFFSSHPAGYGRMWKSGRISAGTGDGYDIRCNPNIDAHVYRYISGKIFMKIRSVVLMWSRYIDGHTYRQTKTG